MKVIFQHTDLQPSQEFFLSEEILKQASKLRAAQREITETQEKYWKVPYGAILLRDITPPLCKAYGVEEEAFLNLIKNDRSFDSFKDGLMKPSDCIFDMVMNMENTQFDRS